MDMLGWTLAAIAAFSVGLAKGGLSMVGTISVPLMALTMSPVQAAGILLPVYIVSDIGGLVAFRRDFDRRVLRTILPGAITGIGLGWATAHLVDDAQVGLIVGLIGLAFALNALLRARVDAAPRPPRWGRALSGAWSRAIPVSCRIPAPRPIRSMPSLCACRR